MNGRGDYGKSSTTLSQIKLPIGMADVGEAQLIAGRCFNAGNGQLITMIAEPVEMTRTSWVVEGVCVFFAGHRNGGTLY